MRFAGFLFATVVLSSICNAQNFYPTFSIPVSKENKQLKNPWVGGLNAPQFSPVDWNGDGKQDIFVFDRGGNKSYAFINKGGGVFENAPAYEVTLPSMENWALIRDFNKDNVPDIFCWANAGMSVYRGKRINGQLSFDLITYTMDSWGNKIPDLLTYTNYAGAGNPQVNIYVLTDDIPGIADINGDGDMDILTFGTFGTSVEYYENATVESAGAYSSDTLVYSSDYYNICWGKFNEAAFTNSVFLGSCKNGGMVSPTGNAGRHAGSSLCPFDKDGDGDMDLLLGDIAYNTMIYLKNGGDSAEANMVEYDTIYPSYNEPVRIPVFPAAYMLDVDDDGVTDMLAAPNARAGYRNVKNVMWYKNVGSNSNYDLRYQTDSFLVDGMLDFGAEAKVAVFDYNGDGLQDIFVGNSLYYLTQNQNAESQIALLLNVGTASAPAFKLETVDFATIKSFNLLSGYPSFGDLDGDGKSDLLIGDENGNLHFFKNTGSSQANFSALTTPLYFGIDAQRYASPYIYDVDGDGDNDLLVGIERGTINFYINYGTKQTPLFHQDSVVQKWGDINVIGQYEINGYAQPFIYKQSGTTYLLVGSNRGAIFKYEVDPSKIRGGSFTLIDSNYLGKSVGRRSTITGADFNGDAELDFVVGNSLGGINFFSSKQMDPTTSIQDELNNVSNWQLYPNPANEYFTIVTNFGEAVSANVYSYDGKLLLSSKFSNHLTVSAKDFPAGLYLIKLHYGDKNEVKKLLITK